MNKPLCVISCPIDCFSGYGQRARDLVKSIIQLKGEEWDIRILSQPWGSTPNGYIKAHQEKWGFLVKYVSQPHFHKKPDIWIQHTVCNEFQPMGVFNIGVTAGLETTFIPQNWVEGCNRMDVTFVSSKHSKDIMLRTIYDKRDQLGNIVESIKINKPIEVLMEGVDLESYFPTNQIEGDIVNSINEIPEDFCFLFLGAWLPGDLAHDRKNVGLLVKAFFETFKNKKIAPALILKTSGGTPSYIDRDHILNKINIIKKSIKADTLPNIYLIHGDLKDEDINKIYNHPKVKTMVNLTKGEGWGRPLLEFSLMKKPIIVSGWSGHMDFLKPEFNLMISGTLDRVHPSAAFGGILTTDMAWFFPNLQEVSSFMLNVYSNYSKYLEGAKRQAFYSKTNFNFTKMSEQLKNHFDKYIPKFAQQVELKLPQLKKIELPSLKRVE